MMPERILFVITFMVVAMLSVVVLYYLLMAGAYVVHAVLQFMDRIREGKDHDV
jgi:hypothetical protein